MAASVRDGSRYNDEGGIAWCAAVARRPRMPAVCDPAAARDVPRRPDSMVTDPSAHAGLPPVRTLAQIARGLTWVGAAFLVASAGVIVWAVFRTVGVDDLVIALTVAGASTRSHRPKVCQRRGLACACGPRAIGRCGGIPNPARRESRAIVVLQIRDQNDLNGSSRVVPQWRQSSTFTRALSEWFRAGFCKLRAVRPGICFGSAHCSSSARYLARSTNAPRNNYRGRRQLLLCKSAPSGDRHPRRHRRTIGTRRAVPSRAARLLLFRVQSSRSES